MPESNHNQDTRQTLDRVYPGPWAQHLLKLSSASHTPIEKFKDWELPERETRLDDLATHVAQGGPIGLLLPDGCVAIDTDNREAYDFISAYELPGTPFQVRRNDEEKTKAHYVFRVEGPLKCKQVRVDGMEVDLKFEQRGFIVVYPSPSRKDDHPYQQMTLPEDPEDVPLAPPELATWLESHAGAGAAGEAPPAREEIPRHSRVGSYLAIIRNYGETTGLRERGLRFARELFLDDPGRAEVEVDRWIEWLEEQPGDPVPEDQRAGVSGWARLHESVFQRSRVFIPPMKGFLRFTGVVWEQATRDCVASDFVGLREELLRAAPSFPDGDPRRASILESYKKLSTPRAKRDAADEIGLRHRGDISEWDAQPHLWVTKDGWAIDLKSWTRRRVEASDKVTVCSGADYVEGAVAQDWIDAISFSVGGDPERVDYLHRLIGAAAIGEHTEDILPFAYGEGGTGKGTFINIVLAAFGGYGTVSTFRVITGDTEGTGHNAMLADWRGRRLIVLDEIEKGVKIGANAKKLTGGDPIKASAKFRDPIEFPATWIVFGQGNNEPEVKQDEKGGGFERRIVEIPFDQRLDEARPRWDHLGELKQAFLDPVVLAGVQNWILEGARKYLESGLGRSIAIEHARREFWSKQGMIERWVAEECAVAPNEWTEKQAAWHEFDQWQRKFRVEERWGRNKFYKELGAAFPTTKRQGFHGFNGIGLGEGPGAESDPGGKPWSAKDIH